MKPGCRRLSGREALWYGRSRTGGSDYARISRQKCLIWALARQAGPLTVLRSFERLSGVFKRSVSTDVPRRLLPPLVDLAAKIRNAEITSLQLSPARHLDRPPRLRQDQAYGGQGDPRLGVGLPRDLRIAYPEQQLYLRSHALARGRLPSNF